MPSEVPVTSDINGRRHTRLVQEGLDTLSHGRVLHTNLGQQRPWHRLPDQALGHPPLLAVGEVLWDDPYEQHILRYALSYQLIGGDPNPFETAITAAVSGLILLSEARYVGAKRLTEDQWNGLKTARQIRRLLVDLGISHAQNPAYGELADQAMAARHESEAKKRATAERRDKTYTPSGEPVDDVDGVVALRNFVAHPRGNDGPVPTQAWAQAWRTVSEWLDLSLLARLGYTGDYVPRRCEVRWVGQVVPVPFITGACALGP